MSERLCAYRPCSKPLVPKTKAHRYCTPACRWHAWDERNPRLPSDMSRYAADFGHPCAPTPFRALLTARESAAVLDGAPLPERCRESGAEPWPEAHDLSSSPDGSDAFAFALANAVTERADAA